MMIMGGYNVVRLDGGNMFLRVDYRQELASFYCKDITSNQTERAPLIQVYVIPLPRKYARANETSDVLTRNEIVMLVLSFSFLTYIALI